MSDFNSKQILEFCDNLYNFVQKSYIAELRATDRSKYVSKCNNKFKEFFERFPTLFYKILDNPESFNKHGRNELLKMLKMKDNIDNNKISHEAASKEIGKKYYNKYVKPVVGDDSTNVSDESTNINLKMSFLI